MIEDSLEKELLKKENFVEKNNIIEISSEKDTNDNLQLTSFTNNFPENQTVTQMIEQLNKLLLKHEIQISKEDQLYE